MPAKRPDTVIRRVAVVLGASGSGEQLLDTLRPLLGKDKETDLLGVFVEDEKLQNAVALPCVKEVCRLTLSIREVHGSQIERTIALRTRTARKAVAELARRMGINHSFLNVRGSTLNCLRDTAHTADITVFEPKSVLASRPVLTPARARHPRRRIVVAVNDLAAGTRALIAAASLAEGRMSRISILLGAADPGCQNALQRMIAEVLPSAPARILLLSKAELKYLIAAASTEDMEMLVLGTSEEVLQSESLGSMLEQLRCPVFLVRRWEGNADSLI